MIDLTAEQPLSLADACRIIPAARGASRTHVSTLCRWIVRGTVAPDGRRVRLRAARIGGRWVTSREAIHEYIAALTPDQDAPAPAPRPTPAQRRRQQAQDMRELEAAGVA